MEERLSWEWEALGCEPERSIQHRKKTRRDLPREGKEGQEVFRQAPRKVGSFYRDQRK